jgi:hypothetical protein
VFDEPEIQFDVRRVQTILYLNELDFMRRADIFAEAIEPLFCQLKI